MSEAEIKTAIFAALRKVAPESDPMSLPSDANIRTALDIDSYDFLNVLIALSETVGVDVPEADYGKLTTPAQMVAYLAERTRV